MSSTKRQSVLPRQTRLLAIFAIVITLVVGFIYYSGLREVYIFPEIRGELFFPPSGEHDSLSLSVNFRGETFPIRLNSDGTFFLNAKKKRLYLGLGSSGMPLLSELVMNDRDKKLNLMTLEINDRHDSSRSPPINLIRINMAENGSIYVYQQGERNGAGLF